MSKRSSKREPTAARPCWQRFVTWWRPVWPRKIALRMLIADRRSPTIPRRMRTRVRGRARGVSKILVVEDNEMNRDMLSRRLQRRGYEVVIAVDGQEGVALAQSEVPDLILMDMSLPVLDGWEATRQLKAASETKSIPIVALTAHAMSDDREKALEAGCDDYDTKPIEMPRLLAEDAADRHQEDFIADLEKIHAAAQRFLVLINDFVDFPTLRAGEGDPSPQASDTSAPIQEAVTAIRPLAEAEADTGQIDHGFLLVVDDNAINRDMLCRW